MLLYTCVHLQSETNILSITCAFCYDNENETLNVNYENFLYIYINAIKFSDYNNKCNIKPNQCNI
jgi:hypothetical protein